MRGKPVGLITTCLQHEACRCLLQLRLASGMEADHAERAIRMLERRIVDGDRSIKAAPWSFVDTDGESADAIDDWELSSALLIVGELNRRLDLPGNVRFEAASEQIRQARRFVREHL